MTLDILQQFAQKRATPYAVMRQLVSHSGWFAPLPWASEVFHTNMFDRVCVWGESSTSQSMPPVRPIGFQIPIARPLMFSTGTEPQ